MISAVYAAIARRRREWYAARPHARRRLRHPVISIGNIAAGGRGKTPFTAAVARILMELGERPAILSRGYARTRPEDGAVVVRDAYGMRADVARAGDEPFMLARQLPGAIVISSPDRYLGGRIAEHHLGATVHLLDDGPSCRLDRVEKRLWHRDARHREHVARGKRYRRVEHRVVHDASREKDRHFRVRQPHIPQT